MAAGLTTTRQQTEVGEGLAIGCLVTGVAGVTAEDGPLDAAFTAAFAAWPWATRYPSLLGRRRPLLGPVLRSSGGRRASRLAHRVTTRGVHSPQLRDDEWDLRAACGLLEEESTVPARRWWGPARAFTDGLGDGQVWRFPPPGSKASSRRDAQALTTLGWPSRAARNEATTRRCAASLSARSRSKTNGR